MEKTLVIGATTNPDRYSHIVIHRLRDKGYPVQAIGKSTGTIDDVKIGTEKLPYEDIHTVSLYLNPKHQPEYYDYIISLNPKRVIFNPGTENPEFSNLLLENGIEVDVACSMVLLASDQY
ncbi:CoA-binding protein [Aureitalea sp. L0-47]|uniref:CoA-binding protein n=1 Tax=Aureitalea sp. L0-47 TaxID=2816962 RepID=UPI0022380CD8|nr:CoA-binding protein [Aureitalea sp. L0-47]MCW5520275.1 CoA-binding protein [Aureitalea sp. L0-47]